MGFQAEHRRAVPADREAERAVEVGQSGGRRPTLGEQRLEGRLIQVVSQHTVTVVVDEEDPVKRPGRHSVDPPQRGHDIVGRGTAEVLGFCPTHREHRIGQRRAQLRTQELSRSQLCGGLLQRGR